MKKPSYIIIHHTAVSYDKNPDQFDANNNYHKKLWNFKSSLGFYLGYNYEISSNGKTRIARKEGEETAATYQQNMNDGRAVHIALDGNFDVEKPKPEQIFALRDLLIDINRRQGIGRKNIMPHNAYANKTCPGNNLDIDFVRTLIPEEETNDITEEIANIKDCVSKILKNIEDIERKLE